MNGVRYQIFLIIIFTTAINMSCSSDGVFWDKAPQIQSDAINDVATTATLPESLRVEIISLQIGPGKSDGTNWDGIGNLTEDLFAFAARAAGLPFPDIIAKMATVAVSSLEKPDIRGTVEWESNGSIIDSISFAEEEDNFQPTLKPKADFQGFNPHTDRITISLTEVDLSEHDSAGEIYLSKQHFNEVLQNGGAHWVNVAEQTNNQILLVRIIITE